ncbi:MAG TPA: metalloregulator ArsR/SmtB family transcription factor [Anaeromyxobacteraceae bacterium]|nr:metalloregulator ArsR/SmtB family transcription factor [Anaeromyxobacteraceae bacterium]
MARASTTTDVFNAIAEAHRREILDVLVGGERPVGAIVDELAISQPQVSKHLRVLSEVGLVRCRAEGRRRLYRLNPTCLRPLHDWVAKYELMLNQRLDKLDDYLSELQRQEGKEDKEPQGAP